MAKKTDGVIDPGELTGPDQIRYLSQKVDTITKEAVNAVKNMGADIMDAIQTDLKEIKPICEQFPNLCKKVDELKESQAASVQTKPKRVHEAADSLALHYQECTDPECRRSIQARLAAVGLAVPPEDSSHVEQKEAAKPEAAAVNAKQPEAAPEQHPWEKLGVAESKYKKHKPYYDAVLANGG